MTIQEEGKLYYRVRFAMLFGMEMNKDRAHIEVNRMLDMQEIGDMLGDWAEEFMSSECKADDLEVFFYQKFNPWWAENKPGFRCKCGCRTFYAHQLVRMDVIVDETGRFVASVSPDAPLSDIYDAETPYGPFCCTNCGKEYEELA